MTATRKATTRGLLALGATLAYWLGAVAHEAVQDMRQVSDAIEIEQVSR